MRSVRLTIGAFVLGFLAVSLGVSQVHFLYDAWLHAGF